jgi:hypothetical protein
MDGEDEAGPRAGELAQEVTAALAAIHAVQARILDALLPGPAWRVSDRVEHRDRVYALPGADGAPGMRLCHPDHASRLIAAAAR